MIFWLVLKLEINYRVMISWRILVSFRGFFLKIIFLHDEIFEISYNSSFCLKILFNNVNGKATAWHTPCYIPLQVALLHLCTNYRPNFFSDRPTNTIFPLAANENAFHFMNHPQMLSSHNLHFYQQVLSSSYLLHFISASSKF